MEILVGNLERGSSVQVLYHPCKRPERAVVTRVLEQGLKRIFTK